MIPDYSTLINNLIIRKESTHKQDIELGGKWERKLVGGGGGAHMFMAKCLRRKKVPTLKDGSV